MTRGQFDHLPPAARRRLRIRAVVRPTLTTIVLLLLYYLLPLGEGFTVPTAATLFVGLVLFIALLTWQVRQIRNARYPGLRAIESLSFSLPLFILAFAAVYFVTASSSPTAFSEALSRTDALYFTVTVFSSVGFGDITAVAAGTRIVVMIQMIGDLILVGIVARVFVGAVKTGLRGREPGIEPD